MFNGTDSTGLQALAVCCAERVRKGLEECVERTVRANFNKLRGNLVGNALHQDGGRNDPFLASFLGKRNGLSNHNVDLAHACKPVLVVLDRLLRNAVRVFVKCLDTAAMAEWLQVIFEAMLAQFGVKFAREQCVVDLVGVA